MTNYKRCSNYRICTHNLPQEWKQISAMIGSADRGGLQKRIKDFDIEELDIVDALKASDLLEGHTVAEVNGFSVIAGIFYRWVRSV